MQDFHQKPVPTDIQEQVTALGDRYKKIGTGSIHDIQTAGVYYVYAAVTDKPTANGGIYVVASANQYLISGIFVDVTTGKTYSIINNNGTWSTNELALNSNIPGKIKGGNVASFYAIIGNNLGQVLDKLESEIANRDGGIIQNISTGSAAYGILLFKLNNDYWSGIITSYAMNGVVYSFAYNNGYRYLSAVNLAW